MGILSWLWRESPNYPGIYHIRNKKTGSVYIGSTARSFGLRWGQHRDLLNKGRHSNKLLQQDWDHFGDEAFEFKIIEVATNEDQILDREQYWINKTRQTAPCYNIRDVGNGDSRYRAKMRRKHGLLVPSDIDLNDPYMPLPNLIYLLAYTQLNTGEWSWTADEIATFLSGQELSKLAILERVEHLRQRTPRAS